MNVVGDALSAPLDSRAAEELVTSHPVDIDPPVAPRTCGRCRQLFAGDPTLHPAALAEWWACDACRGRLGLDPNPRSSSC